MDETGARDAFTRMGTLGIEEEFYVVDDHGRPTSGTDELVYERDPPALLDGRLDHELFKCIIETHTPILESPGEAHESVAAVREALVDHARSNGFAIAAAGLHPLAHWRELEQAEKPRYRSQLDRIQYPQHRNITAGLHVHVGVDDADKATWIANEVRWYLPMLLALSANSPFWNGFDTGLASARAKLFEALPNTGIPTAFDSYASFHRFEQRMVQTGRIKDRGELWFDVRPHSGHGTVEIRTPDSQRDVATVMAFVEYVHALVEDLANRYDEGASGTDIRREFIDENRWRAIRYGHDADLVARDCSRTISLGELVDRECARLGVRGIGSLVEKESGATLQRRLWEEDTATALGNELKL